MNTVNRNAQIIAAAIRGDLQESLESCHEGFSSFDWDEIAKAAHQHGVAAILFKSLQDYSEIPDNARGHLRRMRSIVTAQNLVILTELGKVLRVFEQDRTEVILLKGVHLASTIHDEIGDRPMGDIDILVRRENVRSVDRRLRDLGFRSHEDNDDWFKRFRHVVFTHPKTGISIEVHWIIDNEESLLNIDYDGLWQRSQQHCVVEGTARVLCPEDLLIYLCIHTSCVHFFDFGLRSLFDLHVTLRRYRGTICWSEVERRTKEWRAANYVFLCLHLTEELLHSNIPAEFLNALRPNDYTSALTELARQRILSERNTETIERRKLCNLAIKLKSVSFILRRIFPPRDELARVYSVASKSPLVPFYYFRRPFDLLVRHGGTTTHLLRQTLWRDKTSLTPMEEARLRQWLVPDSTGTGKCLNRKPSGSAHTDR